jgi:hypothetical protein
VTPQKTSSWSSQRNGFRDGKVLKECTFAEIQQSAVLPRRAAQGHRVTQQGVGFVSLTPPPVSTKSPDWLSPVPRELEAKRIATQPKAFYMGWSKWEAWGALQQRKKDADAQHFLFFASICTAFSLATR